MGAISVFGKVILRIIDDDNDFIKDEQTQEKGKMLNEEIIHSEKENESIAATNDSFNYEFMAGKLMIEVSTK